MWDYFCVSGMCVVVEETESIGTFLYKMEHNRKTVRTVVSLLALISFLSNREAARQHFLSCEVLSNEKRPRESKKKPAIAFPKERLKSGNIL